MINLLSIVIKMIDLYNSGEARGQQEGLQYDRVSSRAVESRLAQVENIGGQCDRWFW